MMIVKWLKGSFTKRPGRMLGAIVGIAITMALLSAIGSFISWSGASMTARAIQNVPVDWQIQLVTGASPDAVRTELGKATKFSALETVTYANVTGLEAKTGNSTQQTGPGKVVGISDAYRKNFPAEFRSLIGAKDGVLTTQQCAANLHIQPGDGISIQRPGLPSVQVKLDGVIELPYADSFFQAVGLPPNAAPQAPPDDVLIIPLAQWHTLFDEQATVRPDSIHTQFHVRIDHSFPADPNAAYIHVQHLANNLEARIAGSALIGNNLAARLSAVRADALYARILFLFLGLPGALLAVLLVLFITASGDKHRKREQELLRYHGASSSRILRLQSAEAILSGAGGILVGIVLSLFVDTLLIPYSAATSGLIFGWIAFAAATGLVLAIVAVMIPAWRALHAESSYISASESIFAKPVWQRIYLDMVFLALSGIEFWRTASTGYAVVVAPEGVASIAVNYEAFVAPFFLWAGGVLFAQRIFDLLLTKRHGFMRALIAPIAGRLSGIVAASLSRDRRYLARGILLLSLAVSFAVSTSIFNTTYNDQARVDAELTNGSDVTVTGYAPFVPNDPRVNKIAALPGVAGMQLMQHRFAYVGTDMQDLYGIDPSRIREATNISDTFFGNKNSVATLAALEKHKDGVLVAEETITDFQLKMGDAVNLRLQFAGDHAYHLVPFHIVGIVREFPTAPKDSFFVTNAKYIAEATGNPNYEVILLHAAQSPETLAAAVNGAVGSAGVKVSELGTVQRVINSGITSVDLRGLTSLELVFAIVLLACSVGLVLALGMAERRRNFAVLKMIGAGKKELDAFIRSETWVIFTGGMGAGGILGVGVAWMLIKVLSGVFDPPPEFLSVPWAYMGILLATALLSTIAASSLIGRLARKSAVEEIRKQA